MRRIIGYACSICGLMTINLDVIHQENKVWVDGSYIPCPHNGYPMNENNTYEVGCIDEDDTVDS